MQSTNEESGLAQCVNQSGECPGFLWLLTRLSELREHLKGERALILPLEAQIAIVRMDVVKWNGF